MALPRGSTILITGATGTIGAAVSKEVIKAGYKVRAPIRNAQKGQAATEVFNQRYGAGAFSTVVIPDLTQPGALDEAMKDCAGVVHLASEMGFSADPHKMITPSLAMVKSLLQTAAKTSSVKRFVYTSSQATLPSVTKPGIINGSTWLPDADEKVAFAWAEPYSPEKALVVYMANKISAERACWDFMEREKPSFVLNSVVPGFAIGEVFHQQMISSSNAVVLGVLNSVPSAVGFIQAITPSNFVNLEDCGLLHLVALTMDGVKGKRLLALGETFDLNRMVDIQGRLVPGAKLPPKCDSKEPIAEIDTTFEKGLLKTLGKDEWTGFDESVQQCLLTAKVIS